MRVLLGVLLVLSILTAGCAGPGTDGPGDGNATDGGDGADGDATGSPSPTPTQTRQDQPPPPDQQRVDDPDEVDRPGEYAILPRASDHKDESWSVPSWKKGDAWRYEHKVHAAAGGGVTVEVTDKVSGTGTIWDTDIYLLTRTEHDCKAEGGDCERRLNFTQADLVEIEDNGYIEHTFVFPLQDGKRWVFARSDGKGGVSKVHAEARHVPDYLWPGTTKQVEAWRIVLEYEGEGNVEQKYWVGVDQKNTLRREIWADSQGGVPQMVFSSTLKTYTPG